MKKVDQEVYEAYKHIGGISYLKYFDIPKIEKETQKKLFLDATIDVPCYDKRNINIDELITKKQAFVSLQKRIVNMDIDAHIREAYHRLINEQIHYSDMIEAYARGDMEQFSAVSIELFGEPKNEYVSYIISYITQLCDDAKHVSDEATNHIEHVEYALQNFESDNTVFSEISIDFVQRHNDERMYTAAEIKRLFEQALDDRRITGWLVEIDDTGHVSFIRVEQESKKIIVPADRRLSERHMQGLIAHEIGVHVQRRFNAVKIPLHILSLGLDNYIRAEEGMAKYVEREIYPESLIPSMELYLGIALAQGIDGVKRNFRDLYEFFYAYYSLLRICRPENSDASIEDIAWNRTERIYRGVVGSLNTACFTKDIVYWEGFLRVRDIAHTLPEEINRFLCGKYDPANEFHREFLDAFDVH